MLIGYRILGRKVAASRLRQGLTQQQLADKVGCHVDTIRSIERDRRGSSPDLLDRLCEALHVKKSAITEKAPLIPR